MSLIMGRAGELSQAGTPEPFGAPAAADQTPQASTVKLPPPEMARSDRRGPMRPLLLTPTRTRLTGWMLGVVFRLADAGALALIALAAAPLAAGGIGTASVTPFVVGALLLIWSLSALKAYAFARTEGLGRHLVRVAAGFGLAALGLELL